MFRGLYILGLILGGTDNIIQKLFPQHQITSIEKLEDAASEHHHLSKLSASFSELFTFLGHM